MSSVGFSRTNLDEQRRDREVHIVGFALFDGDVSRLAAVRRRVFDEVW
jgi:hypothetical protein